MNNFVQKIFLSQLHDFFFPQTVEFRNDERSKFILLCSAIETGTNTAIEILKIIRQTGTNTFAMAPNVRTPPVLKC